MKKLYELALILSPELDGQGREALVALVEKMVKQFDGEVDKHEEGGKKMLAYKIKKFNEGWYYFLSVKLPNTALVQLETKLRVEDKVLRYLIISKL